jgi:hypothetical protein
MESSRRFGLVPGAMGIAVIGMIFLVLAVRPVNASDDKSIISTEIEIAASPQRVWDVLSDTAAYERWNPFIHTLSGRLADGETIAVELMPPGQPRFRLPP